MSRVKLLGVRIPHGYSPEARVFASLLRHRPPGHEALVLHQDWPGDRRNAGRFEAEARVRVERLDAGWRPNPSGRRWRLAKAASLLRFLATLPRMVRITRAYDPDIIYSSQQRWDCLAATHIARKLGKPQIIHLHYTVGPWLHGHPLRRLLTCDHVVAVSDFIRGQAVHHGVPSERVTTVRNPVSPFPAPAAGTREAVRGELGVPVDSQLIGIIARLDALKGQGDAIAAFARIAAAHPASRLIIVGEGPARQALRAQAADTDLRERVLFAGRRTDVARVLAALDVFIHPSRYEPFGLAVAEASASGLPVVAYAEGGISEIVVDGETGLLAPAGDTGALAASLAALLSEPVTARRMGAAGRARIEANFRPQDAGLEFAAVLESVLGQGVPVADAVEEPIVAP